MGLRPAAKERPSGGQRDAAPAHAAAAAPQHRRQAAAALAGGLRRRRGPAALLALQGALLYQRKAKPCSSKGPWSFCRLGRNRRCLRSTTWRPPRPARRRDPPSAETHSTPLKPAETLSAPQINLFLRVVRRREDGYHDLASLFHVIDLGDGMEFETLPEGAERDVLTCDMDGVPTDDSNLVIKVRGRGQGLGAGAGGGPGRGGWRRGGNR